MKKMTLFLMMLCVTCHVYANRTVVVFNKNLHHILEIDYQICHEFFDENFGIVKESCDTSETKRLGVAKKDQSYFQYMLPEQTNKIKSIFIINKITAKHHNKILSTKKFAKDDMKECYSSGNDGLVINYMEGTPYFTCHRVAIA